MKKLIAGISVLAVATLGAQSVFAETGWFDGDHANEISIISKNFSNINTVQATSSNSGYNEANAKAKSYTSGWGWGSDDSYHNGVKANGGTIVTGGAAAEGTTLVAANENDTRVDLAGCGCETGGDVWNKITIYNKNVANVNTLQATSANSGYNQANAKATSSSKAKANGGDIMTGNVQAVGNVGVVAGSNTTVVTVH